MNDETSLAKRDLICGLVLIVFSVVAFSQLTDLPFRAAIFPQVMLASIFTLAIILAVKSYRKMRLARGPSAEAEVIFGTVGEEKAPDRPESNLLMTATVVTIALYIFFMPILGFFLSTIFFVFAILFTLKMRRFFLMAFLAVLTGTVVFVIFKTVMYVSLPGGIYDPTELLYRLID
jgi:hypothetical protein